MTLTCSHCGAEHVVEIIAGVNAASEPELKAKIKDGSAFVAECPYCGYRSLVGGQMLYHDPSERVMVWLLPESDSLSEQQREIVSAGIPGLDGYSLRRVLSAGDMIEKVNIFDAGLDDRVMELCKYVTRMELAENGQGFGEGSAAASAVGSAASAASAASSGSAASAAGAEMKFFRMDGADNTITISFPYDGKMQLAEVGFNVYEDCRGILARNPSIKEDPGFALIDSSWVARFFR